MAGIGSAAAWLLAITFGWAGGAKLRHPRVTARAFEAMHLPAPGVLALAVPLVELFLAVALVVAPPVGSALALLLLAAFSALLASRLRAGISAGCGCFGASQRRPLDAASLVRNGLLAAAGVAGLAGSFGVPDLPSVLVAGAGSAVGIVVLGLSELKVRTGRIWDNTLPRGLQGNEPVAPPLRAEATR